MTPPDDELREAVFLAVREAVETSDDLSAQTFRKAAAAVLALPEVAALRAKAAAADRVWELADELVSESNDGEPTGYDWGLRSAAVRLRAALDGPDQTDRGRC